MLLTQALKVTIADTNFDHVVCCGWLNFDLEAPRVKRNHSDVARSRRFAKILWWWDVFVRFWFHYMVMGFNLWETCLAKLRTSNLIVLYRQISTFKHVANETTKDCKSYFIYWPISLVLTTKELFEPVARYRPSSLWLTYVARCK